MMQPSCQTPTTAQKICIDYRAMFNMLMEDYGKYGKTTGDV